MAFAILRRIWLAGMKCSAACTTAVVNREMIELTKKCCESRLPSASCHGKVEEAEEYWKVDEGMGSYDRQYPPHPTADLVS